MDNLFAEAHAMAAALEIYGGLWSVGGWALAAIATICLWAQAQPRCQRVLVRVRKR